MVGAALNAGAVHRADQRGVSIVKAAVQHDHARERAQVGARASAPGEYDFDAPDRYVAFGERNGMFIVGHTLVWHSQTPRWVFYDANGNRVSRDTLLARMRDHIHTVVGRYKGRIKGWDVVNEALNEDGTLRKSPWLEIIGQDYIAKAFQFAHEADPQAELYYNDYSVENAPKRNGAVALVEELQAQGVRVTAVGLQGHNKLDWPTRRAAGLHDRGVRGAGREGARSRSWTSTCCRARRGAQTADVSAAARRRGRAQPVRGRAAGLGAAGAREAICGPVRRYMKHRGRHHARHVLGRRGRRLVAERLAGARADELSVIIRSGGAAEARVRRSDSCRATWWRGLGLSNRTLPVGARLPGKHSLPGNAPVVQRGCWYPRQSWETE